MANGTITVNPVNTVTLTSGAGTNNQTVPVNTAMTNITFSTVGATGISNSGVSGANGLPPGVAATFAGNAVAGTITISGTPTSIAGSPYAYSISLTGGCGTVSATGTITVNPSNDLCADALPITCGATVSGTTVGATVDGATFCGTSNTAPGVWYSFTGNGDYITLTTCSAVTNYDTKISVYSGSCAALTCVAGNDDDFACGFSGFQSTVKFLSTTGTNYFILVHGFGSGTGAFELIMTCCTPPTPFTVTGGGAYCNNPGAIPNAVGLSGSQTGVNYQLFLGGVATGAPVPGTGAAISFGPQGAVGTYTVVGTTVATTCPQTMTGCCHSINDLLYADHNGSMHLFK